MSLNKILFSARGIAFAGLATVAMSGVAHAAPNPFQSFFQALGFNVGQSTDSQSVTALSSKIQAAVNKALADGTSVEDAISTAIDGQPASLANQALSNAQSALSLSLRGTNATTVLAAINTVGQNKGFSSFSSTGSLVTAFRNPFVSGQLPGLGGPGNNIGNNVANNVHVYIACVIHVGPYGTANSQC